MSEVLKNGNGEQVGYKSPPVHSRFKKGQSGNPGGRRRLKNGTLRDTLASLLEKQWDGDDQSTFMDLIAHALFNRARQGNTGAIALLLREFE